MRRSRFWLLVCAVRFLGKENFLSIFVPTWQVIPISCQLQERDRGFHAKPICLKISSPLLGMKGIENNGKCRKRSGKVQ